VAKPSARTEVSISASYAAANRKPEYPKMSLRLGEQGTVVLTVMVKSFVIRKRKNLGGIIYI
jgi:protein TonB